MATRRFGAADLPLRSGWSGTFSNRFTYDPTWRWTASVALVFLVAMLFISDAATFLYFVF